MKTLSVLVRVLALGSAFALCSACADTAASVSGTVFDPQSKPIPRARVALFSDRGDSLLTTETDASGKYTFVDLHTGDYLLEASAPGFSAYRERNVHLQAGKPLSLDLRLALGTVAE
ncbi:MAG: carboxypeptidase-like regulatory domain-containing protein, partial [Candidatus Acidiferrales bacterium]